MLLFGRSRGGGHSYSKVGMTLLHGLIKWTINKYFHLLLLTIIMAISKAPVSAATTLMALLCKLHKSGGGGAVKLDSMWQHRLTRPLHVQHTYYRIIFKQNPFNIISRGVQGCTWTDFRLK